MAWHNTKRSVVNAFFLLQRKRFSRVFLFANPSAHTLTEERRVPWSVEKCSKRCLRSIGIFVPLCFFSGEIVCRELFSSSFRRETRPKASQLGLGGELFPRNSSDESMREDWRKKQTVNHNFPLRLLFTFRLGWRTFAWDEEESNLMLSTFHLRRLSFKSIRHSFVIGHWNIRLTVPTFM